MLEAAHHKFQRRIWHISWKEKVRNVEVKGKTALQNLELIIKKRKLRWFGHVLRTNDGRLPKHFVIIILGGDYKAKAGKTNKELD